MIDVVANSLKLRSGRGDYLRHHPWTRQTAPGTSKATVQTSPDFTAPDFTAEVPSAEAASDIPPQAGTTNDAQDTFVWRRIRHGMPAPHGN